ncbi:MAG: hypothetical protein UY50_C0022G0029 [Parcubacteria group bacterium GW2011_GWA2_49_9]|nr:MAG: hypothetical protein UY50_C0022G0029 [Parcubacteria group bacterium GW2011_GWA2_49_9]
MDEMQKVENARDTRDMLHKNALFAEERSGEAASEFTRLEVQIATFLFTFSSLFLGSFIKGLSSFSHAEVSAMKWAFACMLFFLIVSLVLGLVHLKRKERFWDEMIHQRIRRWEKWNDASRKRATFEEAEAFHEGAAKGSVSGASPMVFTPNWTWILQTIFLGLGIVLIFAISLIFLFQGGTDIISVLPE